MRRTRHSQIVALFGLTLAGAAAWSPPAVADAQEPTSAAASVEIIDNPDVLLTEVPAARLTLNGVHLGDPTSAIPERVIKFRRRDHIDCTNGAYLIVNDRVWSMTLLDPEKLARMRVPPQENPQLIQMRLGKADECEVDAADGRWRGYWYALHRVATYHHDDNATGWKAITVCE